MTFRKTTLTDLNAIHALRKAAILAINAKEISPSECRKWANARTPEYFAPRIEAELLIIAKNERGEIIAWGSSDEQRIDGIYVKPELSHRGVGRQLMEKLEKQISKRGYSSARLAASINAIGFYKKIGYVAIDNMRNDKTMPMMKKL